MQYKLQLKGDEARNRGRRRHKIHNVKLTSSKTQFQETQNQGSSQNHGHSQNQEKQYLQSTNFYQNATSFSSYNKSNDQASDRKAVNSLIPEAKKQSLQF